MENKDKIKYVSTGLLPVDIMLTGKGLKTGKLYEMYGAESIGKTTIPIQFAIEFTKQIPNSQIIYIDTEVAFDEESLERYIYQGGDINKFVYFLDYIEENRKSDKKGNPIMFNEILEALKTYIEKNKDKQLFIIWDSIPATLEDTSGQIGSLARLMSRASKELRPRIVSTYSVIFFLNHIYSRIGSIGNTTKGGRATKYYSDVRIEAKKKKEYVDEVGDGVQLTKAIQLELTTKKNKLFFAGISVPIYLEGEKGVDIQESLLQFLELNKLVTSSSGSWKRFKYDDIDFKYQNKKQFFSKLTQYPQLIDIVNYLIVKKYSSISPLTKYNLLPKLNELEEKLGKEKTELSPSELEELGKIKEGELV